MHELWLMMVGVGTAAATALLLLWVRSRLLPYPDRALLGLRGPLARLIERRLGGYRHWHTEPDPAQPERLSAPLRVAVVGGGLAGIGAATTLGERGAEVVVFEKNPYFGGKLGGWSEATSDGSVREVEHGFHAFFRHYYNLNAFLDRLGLTSDFHPVEDYQILGIDGRAHSYRHVDTAPVLNLWSLGAQGVFRWSEILRTQALHEMDRFLQYDEETTFAELDHVSFETFAQKAELPPSLMLSFNSFSRAFFADPDRLSTAELIKSFHFYYLSQDAGLIYDIPSDHYTRSLLDPIRAHLEANGCAVRLDTAVTALDRHGDGFRVNGEAFDAVVLAADVVGTAALARASWLDDAPATAARLRGLKAGQRYSVIRLWLDGPVGRHDLAQYLVLDRQRALDAVALYHRIERGCAAWAAQTGGSVIELHCYALPDDLPDDAVRDLMVDEFLAFFPEARELEIVTEHVQIRQDFPAFHVGMYAGRPTTETEVPGLVLAGDWVKLPFPAALMEAAFTSGVLAANALLRQAGVRQAPVWRVPTQGVLVGLPEAPGKKRVSFGSEPGSG